VHCLRPVAVLTSFRSWDGTKWAIANSPTSSSCVSINPMEAKPSWSDDDDLAENRVSLTAISREAGTDDGSQGMGNFIILPDQRLFLSNGVSMGSAGYGYDSWAVNQRCVPTH
jgi:hypothetical protein